MSNNRPKRTIRAAGKVNRGKVSPGKARAKRSERRKNKPSSIMQMELVLDQQREIYNASLEFLQHQAETDPRVLREILRKEVTQLRAVEPKYRKTLRGISITTTERAVTNHLRYAAPREGTKPAGRPRRKTQERFRTLILHSPAHPVIHFSTQGRAKLKLKGLPSIRLDSHQEIPKNQQPKSVHLTLRGMQISVRLVYDREPSPKLKPIRELNNPLGLDLGAAITLAASNGQTYTSPQEKQLNTRIQETQRALSRKTSVNIREKRCGVRALLDEDNRQVVSDSNDPRYRLVWLEEPTKAYAKTQKTLTRLHDQRNILRHDFRQRVTTEIVQAAQEQGVDLLVVEDLRIPNMTKSARGNRQKPGRNVRAKSGLNRAILRQGWGIIITTLKYKAERAGIRVVEVWPARSSQTCSHCWAIDPKSRKRRQFQCTNCGFQDDADLNASRVIAQRGLEFLQKKLKQKAGPDNPGRDTGRGRARGATKPQAN